MNDLEVVYHYDNDHIPRFNTYNNRLEYFETFDTGGTPQVLLSTTYYYYWCNGNPNRIVTHVEGTQDYSAVRFEYARNGVAVTHVLGETWAWDGASGCESNNTYDVTFAREFRYDGARARYYEAVLNKDSAKIGVIQVGSEMWSDYDGDQVYGDYTVVGGSPPTITDVRSFEPGLGRSAWTAGVPGAADYYHSNLLGTTRFMTNSNAAQIESSAFTGFGERINGSVSGPEDRYGYAGGWGYQAHRIDEVDPPMNPEEAFPYLHVGRRYYDPATGRFLQRDPIGILGGVNVYAYVRSNPTIWVDLDGTARYNLKNAKGRFRPKPWWKGGGKAGLAGLIILCLDLAERHLIPLLDDVIEDYYEKKYDEINNPPEPPPGLGDFPGPPADGPVFA